MDRRTSVANRRRPLSRCLPPFEPFEEDHMEGMGPMDSIEEAELDVTRPARPRNECDRGSLSRSARPENASDDRHRRADVSHQPPGGEQDDVHDRQGRGEPRGVIVSHLDDRPVLRNGELRPSHSDLRGGARGQDLRRRKVLQELDGSTLQRSGDHRPKLDRKIRDDDSIRPVALDDGSKDFQSALLADRRMRLGFQFKERGLESIRQARLGEYGSAPDL